MATENESDVQKALAAFGGAPIQYRSFGQPEVRPTPLEAPDVVAEPPSPSPSVVTVAVPPEPSPAASPLGALSPAGLRTSPLASPLPPIPRPVASAGRVASAPPPDTVPAPAVTPAAYRSPVGAALSRGRSLPEVFSLLAGRG